MVARTSENLSAFPCPSPSKLSSVSTCTFWTLDALESGLKERKAIFICDATVYGQYKSLLRGAVNASKDHLWISVAGGESLKSFVFVEEIIDKIFSHGVDRHTVIVAIGGGSVGDMSGFVASILLRGVEWIYIPTTLLAQVDASVGGKTALNLSQGKNLVGTFHFPKMVICDTRFLESLPEREMKSGYVEIYKHALLAGLHSPFLRELHHSGLDILKAPAFLSRVIQESLHIKSQIIGEDWFEQDSHQGKRSLLNLGHTFGHGFEALSNYNLTHGEAVALGLCAELDFGVYLGVFPPTVSDIVTYHLSQCGFNLDYDSFLQSATERESFFSLISRDKKNKNGFLSFVFYRPEVEKMQIMEGVPLAQVQEFFSQNHF